MTAPPRTLTVITGDAAQAPCGHCHTRPGAPCTPHVARIAAAYEAGYLSGSDVTTALDAAGVFTNATLILGSADPARLVAA